MGMQEIKQAKGMNLVTTTKYLIHQDTKVCNFVTKQIQKQISELVKFANMIKPSKKLWDEDPKRANKNAEEHYLTWGQVGHLQQLRMRLKKRTEGRQLELL